MSLMALWRSLWTTASSTLPGVSVMIAIQSGRIKSEWLTLSLTDQWCDCMSMIPTPMTIQHWSIPLALWSFALGTFLSTQSLGWKEGGWVVVSPSPRFWTEGSLELSWEFGVPRVKTVLHIYIYIGIWTCLCYVSIPSLHRNSIRSPDLCSTSLGNRWMAGTSLSWQFARLRFRPLCRTHDGPWGRVRTSGRCDTMPMMPITITRGMPLLCQQNQWTRKSQRRSHQRKKMEENPTRRATRTRPAQGPDCRDPSARRCKKFEWLELI